MASAKKIVRQKIISPLKEFIADSRASGILLLLFTIFSLTMSNSFVGTTYIHFWQKNIFTYTPLLHLPESLVHIINDGLMSIFFLLVGLEIKRELLIGELAELKKATLPIFAAIGGMIVPAIIFLLCCGGTPLSNGWGIPIATDIAFSLAALSLLGKRVPVSLKIFLMALAIIDDLGGIITIAIFYAAQIQWNYLFLCLIVLVVFFLLRKFLRHLVFHFIVGILLWYLLFNSGVHASIAGVITALLLPLSKTSQLEHRLHIPVHFIILPLFAMANTAIIFPEAMDDLFFSKTFWGIFLGLVLGKPLGIVLFSWLSVRLKIATLPQSILWKQLIGIGIIAGIGFTISIFITTLAYADNELLSISKMTVLIASFVAAILGYVFFRIKKSA